MPPQSRAELNEWQRRDLQAYIASNVFPKDPGRWRWWHRFRYPLIHWQRVLRKTEYVASAHPGPLWLPWVLFLKWRFLRRSLELNLEIPLNVFGPGLVISHCSTIVVNSKARVGENCRIHPGVCIGELKDGNPVIGDNVYLGNGAIVIGDITIGDRAKVGPHALVRKSVAADSIVVSDEGRELAPASSTSVSFRDIRH